MTFSEYARAAGRTANIDMEKVMQRLQENPELLPLMNAGFGLGGEGGEVEDHIKKVVFHGHALDKQYLSKEVGDLLWYLALLADTLGVSLNSVATGNVKKLKRRYPEGFSEERSINRTE